MTVATIEPTPTAVGVINPSTDLAQAVLNLQAATTFAEGVCRTSLVPAAYRGKPDEAAVAILYGAEVGFQPMQSLQQVVVVKGSPGLYAKAAVALVISRGHMIWVESSSPEQVVVCGRNRHWPADVPNVREVWNLDRAKAAGYYAQNRANYDGKPEEMYYARGAMNTARKVDPSALLGLPFSAEELADGDFVTGEVIAAPPAYVAPAIPAQRATDERPLDVMTAAQSRALNAGLTDLGLTDRQDRLEWCAREVRRPLESSRDLTKDEASRLIEATKREVPADTTTGEVDAGWGAITGDEVAGDEAADRGGA